MRRADGLHASRGSLNPLPHPGSDVGALVVASKPERDFAHSGSFVEAARGPFLRRTGLQSCLYGHRCQYVRCGGNPPVVG